MYLKNALLLYNNYILFIMFFRVFIIMYIKNACAHMLDMIVLFSNFIYYIIYDIYIYYNYDHYYNYISLLYYYITLYVHVHERVIFCALLTV